jgi:hypothetical protein
MHGVDEHADGRGKAGPPSQPYGVRQVRVDHFGPGAPEPAVEAEPSARVSQAFAHAQAQEVDSCGREMCSGFTSRAGEGDDRDPPAATGKAHGQHRGLPLGAADAIKTGNDESDVVGGSLIHGPGPGPNLAKGAAIVSRTRSMRAS